MPKRSTKGFGPYKGYYPQKYLYEYLKIDIDPYDFHHFIEEWAEKTGTKVEPEALTGDLSQEQIKVFEKWLIDNGKGDEYLEMDPAGAPAYLTLRNPEKMPKGTWGIHYTKAGSFDAFGYGATIPRLALSTWYKEKEKAQCPANLTDQLGTYDYVYIFSFLATRYPLSYGSSKYGKNAVLFQTDAGVEATHIGDEEEQLIVPACSEYNVVPLHGVDGGIIACSFKDDEGSGLEFETIKDLINYIETEEKKGSRPLARIRC